MAVGQSGSGGSMPRTVSWEMGEINQKWLHGLSNQVSDRLASPVRQVLGRSSLWWHPRRSGVNRIAFSTISQLGLSHVIDLAQDLSIENGGCYEGPVFDLGRKATELLLSNSGERQAFLEHTGLQDEKADTSDKIIELAVATGASVIGDSCRTDRLPAITLWGNRFIGLESYVNDANHTYAASQLLLLVSTTDEFEVRPPTPRA